MIPGGPLKASSECLAGIKSCEAFRSVAYQDSVGVWTIGYGSTDGVKPGDTIAESAADLRLRRFVSAALEPSVNKLVTVRITQRQFDALIDFEYNLGRNALDHSTLLRKLNLGDYAGAAAEFPNWCHAGDTVLAGLLRRRLTEQARFEEKAA